MLNQETFSTMALSKFLTNNVYTALQTLKHHFETTNSLCSLAHRTSKSKGLFGMELVKNNAYCIGSYKNFWMHELYKMQNMDKSFGF